VDSFIGRHLSELIEVKSTPQEGHRLQVPQIFLDEIIHCMREPVNGRPSDFLLNLNEVGISE
jgi:hypothetical protein